EIALSDNVATASVTLVRAVATCPAE
ncbi:unnamed protein product, partial [Rotaria sordida]